MNSKTTAIIAFSILVIGIVGIVIIKKHNAQLSPVISEQVTTIIPVPTAPGGGVVLAQSQINQTPLSLVIESPRDNEVVVASQETIMGKTSPLADVFVNDISLKSDNQGNFSVPVTLQEGDNEIIIDVNNTAGDAVEKVINITYNQP